MGGNIALSKRTGTSSNTKNKKSLLDTFFFQKKKTCAKRKNWYDKGMAKKRIKI